MTLLEDNHAGALYNYLIGVQTGHRKNAGTTANVRVAFYWIVIYAFLNISHIEMKQVID